MFYILGGAPEWVSVPTPEGPLRVALAISLSVDEGELDADQTLTVILQDDEGELARVPATVHPIRRDPSAYVAGAPLLVNLPAFIEGPVRRVGAHMVRLLQDGTELAATRFGVRLAG